MFRKLNDARNAAFSPDLFLATIWKQFPQLSGFKQQDSDELLRNIIEQMEIEQRRNLKNGNLVDNWQGELQTQVFRR